MSNYERTLSDSLSIAKKSTTANRPSLSRHRSTGGWQRSDSRSSKTLPLCGGISGDGWQQSRAGTPIPLPRGTTITRNSRRENGWPQMAKPLKPRQPRELAEETPYLQRNLNSSITSTPRQVFVMSICTSSAPRDWQPIALSSPMWVKSSIRYSTRARK